MNSTPSIEVMKNLTFSKWTLTNGKLFWQTKGQKDKRIKDKRTVPKDTALYQFLIIPNRVKLNYSARLLSTQATRSLTASTDTSNPLRSSAVSSTSKTRSAPLAPITHGTPQYNPPSTPYSPFN